MNHGEPMERCQYREKKSVGELMHRRGGIATTSRQHGKTGKPCDCNRVVLFDDYQHTFKEVIVQLVKATGCTRETAFTHAIRVHTKGSSIVCSGSMQECLKVSDILQQISLRTQIVA